MNGQRDDVKLKLAWQTAYELRTCPDSGTLRAPVPDDNLKRHLEICHLCRDKREMQENDREAWKSLREKFAALAMKPGSGTEKQAGQVWTIKREFGGWRDDGRFIRPPSVLLLENIEGTSGWRVAQLYGDSRLMGSGDVELDECYGFAEAWNCYSMKDDRLDVCLGGVKPDELAQVIAASVRVHELAPEGSIRSFFRRMEIEVGAFVAVPAVVELVREWETASDELIELIPGLKVAVHGAKDFVVDIAAGTLELLRGMFKPALVLRGGTTSPKTEMLSEEQKRLILEHCPVIPVEMKVVGDTLNIKLKWLLDKPVELPCTRIRVFLDGIELEDGEFVSAVIGRIVYKHQRLLFLKSVITKPIRIRCAENGLSLDISGGDDESETA